MNNMYINQDTMNMDDINNLDVDKKQSSIVYSDLKPLSQKDDPFSIENNPDPSIFNIDIGNNPADTQMDVTEMISSTFVKNMLDIGLSYMSPMAWATFRGIDTTANVLGLYEVMSNIFSDTKKGDELQRLQFISTMPFGFGQVKNNYSNSMLLARGLFDAASSAGVTSLLYGGNYQSMAINSLLTAISSFSRDNNDEELAKTLNVLGYGVNMYSLVNNYLPSYSSRMNNMWSYYSNGDLSQLKYYEPQKIGDLLSNYKDTIIDDDTYSKTLKEMLINRTETGDKISQDALTPSKLADLEAMSYNDYIKNVNSIRTLKDVESARIQSSLADELGIKLNHQTDVDTNSSVLADKLNYKNIMTDEYSNVLSNGGANELNSKENISFIRDNMDKYRLSDKSIIYRKASNKLIEAIEDGDYQKVLRYRNEFKQKSLGSSADNNRYADVSEVADKFVNNLTESLSPEYQDRYNAIKPIYDTLYKLDDSTLVTGIKNPEILNMKITPKNTESFNRITTSVSNQLDYYSELFPKNKINRSLFNAKNSFVKDIAYKSNLEQRSFSDGLFYSLDSNTANIINNTKPNVMELDRALGEMNQSASEALKIGVSGSLLDKITGTGKKAIDNAFKNDKLAKIIFGASKPAMKALNKFTRVFK